MDARPNDLDALWALVSQLSSERERLSCKTPFVIAFSIWPMSVDSDAAAIARNVASSSLSIFSRSFLAKP
jgi:hypothetical protein